jgi:hypothetical protein
MKITVFWDVAPCSLVEISGKLLPDYTASKKTIPEDSHL